MAKEIITCFLLWISLLTETCGTRCYYGFNEWRDCEYGCCGGDSDSWDSHSWDSWDNDDWDSVCCTQAGLIVGCVIGGLAVIAFIVVVIICCIKHKGKSGRIIGTGRQKPSVAVINQHAYMTQQQQPVGSYGQTYGQPYSAGYSGQQYGQQYQNGSTGQAYGQPYQTAPTQPPPSYGAQYPPGPPPSAGMYNDPAFPPVNPPAYSNSENKQPFQ